MYIKTIHPDRNVEPQLLIGTAECVITLTSKWPRWRLKSPASRLFTQLFIQMQIKENIKAPASLAFVWGIHRDRWIPRTKGQLRGKFFHLMTSSCNHMMRVHEHIDSMPLSEPMLISHRNKLQWNRNRNSYIFIQDKAFEYIVWKMAVILCWKQNFDNFELWFETHGLIAFYIQSPQTWNYYTRNLIITSRTINANLTNQVSVTNQQDKE